MSNIPLSQRRQFVGSSEIASLFSVDLHERGHKVRESRYELWARKSGLLESTFQGNERTEAGQILESAIAEMCARRHGWSIRKAHRYVLHPTVDRMGASPDYEIVSHDLGAGWLEIKNVDKLLYLSWPRVEGADDEAFCEAAGVPYMHRRREPPLSMQLQLQHQMACSPSRQWGALGILVGGNELVTIPYPRVDVSIRRIEEEVPMFWAEVDSGVPPAIDWSVDAGTVSALYGYADPLQVRNMRSDQSMLALAREHLRLSEEISSRQKRRDILKARILSRIGDASKAFLPDGVIVSAPVVRGRDVCYYRNPYRAFRVNQKRSRR